MTLLNLTPNFTPLLILTSPSQNQHRMGLKGARGTPHF
jgi:hypothetical protein